MLLSAGWLHFFFGLVPGGGSWVATATEEVVVSRAAGTFVSPLHKGGGSRAATRGLCTGGGSWRATVSWGPPGQVLVSGFGAYYRGGGTGVKTSGSSSRFGLGQSRLSLGTPNVSRWQLRLGKVSDPRVR